MREHHPFYGQGPSGTVTPVTQVAGVDARPDAVMLGIQRFAVRSVHLVAPADRPEGAQSLAGALGALRVPAEVHVVARSDLARLIDLVAGLLHTESDAVLNLSGGWEEYAIAALTAAFLTGKPAYVVQGEGVVPVPVLRVSYPEVLSPAKIRVLRRLAEVGGTMRLKELAGATGLSRSLVSYHLRGYRDRPGLEDMGLVEPAASDRRGNAVRLTPLGRNLLASGVKPGDGGQAAKATRRTLGRLGRGPWGRGRR
jgi:DNA-binding transcriptional ArsR family regulator